MGGIVSSHDDDDDDDDDDEGVPGGERVFGDEAAASDTGLSRDWDLPST